MNNKKRGNESNENQSAVNRRDLLKGAAVAGLGIATGAYGTPKNSRKPSKSPKSDLIQRENAKPGTRDWLLTKTRTVPGKINNILLNGRSQVIEGYCSANSVRAGEKLQVMVSANPESAFKLEIFRTGYYNGDGARLMKRFDSLKGITQPDPPVGENYVRECQWEPSVEFEIPKDWLSGVYLGKLTAEKTGIQSYVIFIVRDDRPCDLL
ncbi:MAG: twin-arginine translocation signal domain-containing protein, partial [Alphaproteobacteria bacterium]|nr:twin-arginine translocation signal domain-containing protein [Alphaproteobacteria bacterium]